MASRPPPSSAEIVVEAHSLSKDYGDRPVLRGASFEISAGEVVGLLGPNGAGKTTTFKLLAGLISPSTGSVRVFGSDPRRPSRTRQAQVGYLQEHPALYPKLRVGEYLRLVACLKGLPRSKQADEVERVVERLALRDYCRHLIEELSGGYRKRVGIAQALLADPPLLLLDEPTAGLDPRQASRVRSLIAELGARSTILWSTHLLPDVTAGCSRVLIVSEGRIMADGTLRDLVATHGRGPEPSLEQVYVRLTEG